MKRLVLKMVSRFGFELVHRSVWRDVQLRLHRAEKGPPPSGQTDKPELSPDQRYPSELRAQLAACINERDDLSARVGRANTIVDVFEHERARLHSEMEANRAQLSNLDNSGRIRELEIENKRLRLQVTDLEMYLKESRKAASAYR
jgi:hypothetical protein